MAAIVSSIEIDRPAAEVFAYAADPARFPEWQADVVRVSVDGASFTTTRRIGGTERTQTQNVTDVSAPHHWAATGVDGPIRASASITVEPLGEDRCRATFSLDFEGHGLGVPLVPMVRKLAAKGAPVSYQRLKELLEGAGQVPKR